MFLSLDSFLQKMTCENEDLLGWDGIIWKRLVKWQINQWNGDPQLIAAAMFIEAHQHDNKKTWSTSMRLRKLVTIVGVFASTNLTKSSIIIIK